MDNRGEPTLISTPASLQATGDNHPSTKQVFIPQETLDEPFDVTLVTEDGNEFRAHKHVLSKASPFFEKLLKSDMRESNEGVVRLEMLTELGLRDILEFIYTGNVQISAEDNAQDLIAMADYFDLPHLKILAERVLMQELTVLNCISTYCLAKRYQCEELIRDTKYFIHSNFTVVAKTEEFFDLSSQDVKMFISSDEINVTAEEDVFKTILKWIDHDKGDRKKHFADLFREVRLVHVSRDFLCRDVVTNDLVNDNEDCMDLVKDALKLIDSKHFYHLRVTPRWSLVSSALVVRKREYQEDHQILCYHPHDAKWSKFHDTVLLPTGTTGEIIYCHGEMYFISRRQRKYNTRLTHYELSSASWVPVKHPCTEENKGGMRLFKCFAARNEIYALDVERYCNECLEYEYTFKAPWYYCDNFTRHVSLLKKYKPESNSWEDITSFDLGWKIGICIVAKDNFIYFLGGGIPVRDMTIVKDAGRYDVSTNTWDKIADLQEPRIDAYGGVAYGKIFVAGGWGPSGEEKLERYELYNELTNEWQYIAAPSTNPWATCMCTCVNDKVYAFLMSDSDIVECYDPYSNSWINITRIPAVLSGGSGWKCRRYSIDICSMKVIKPRDLIEERPLEEPVQEPIEEPTGCKCTGKCAVM